MNSKYLVPVLVVLTFIFLGGGGYFYLRTQTNSSNAPKNGTQEDVRQVVNEVGKLMELPTGEDPTVATVTDIAKLKDQPFFQKAKNGDKVLIYASAKKAILYNPSLRKIIDVSSINTATNSASEQVKTVLRNGTLTVGLTVKTEAQLKKAVPQVNVIAKENAQKSSYDKSIIVVINDSAKEAAQNIAKALKAEVGELPTGEIKPKEADILVILGKDSI